MCVFVLLTLTAEHIIEESITSDLSTEFLTFGCQSQNAIGENLFLLSQLVTLLTDAVDLLVDLDDGHWSWVSVFGVGLSPTPIRYTSLGGLTTPLVPLP